MIRILRYFAALTLFYSTCIAGNLEYLKGFFEVESDIDPNRGLIFFLDKSNENRSEVELLVLNRSGKNVVNLRFDISLNGDVVFSERSGLLGLSSTYSILLKIKLDSPIRTEIDKSDVPIEELVADKTNMPDFRITSVSAVWK